MLRRKDVEGRGAEGWSGHKSQIFKKKSAELKDNAKTKVIGCTAATWWKLRSSDVIQREGEREGKRKTT
jgi:hypothetical protein